MIMFPNQPVPSINDEFTREFGFAFSLVLSVESSIKYLYMEDIMRFELFARYKVKPTTETLEDVWSNAFRQRRNQASNLAKQSLHSFITEQLSKLEKDDPGSWLALNRVSCWRNMLAHASVIMGTSVALHFPSSKFHVDRILKYIGTKEAGYVQDASGERIGHCVIYFNNLRCVLRDTYILDKYFFAQHDAYVPVDWSEIENALPRLKSEIGYYDTMIEDWAKEQYVGDGGVLP